MSEEQHTPYFSIRLRTKSVTSPKDYVGYKESTEEVIFGNAEKIVTARNPDDVAQVIKATDMLDAFKQIESIKDQMEKDFGWKFIDRIEKYKIDLGGDGFD